LEAEPELSPQNDLKSKENTNARKYLVCAPAAHSILIRLLRLFAFFFSYLFEFKIYFVGIVQGQGLK